MKKQTNEQKKNWSCRRFFFYIIKNKKAWIYFFPKFFKLFFFFRNFRNVLYFPFSQRELNVISVRTGKTLNMWPVTASY